MVTMSQLGRKILGDDDNGGLCESLPAAVGRNPPRLGPRVAAGGDAHCVADRWRGVCAGAGGLIEAYGVPR